MWHFWWGFWWLIFPIGGMLMAVWSSWLSYLRRKHELDLLKTYAAQGKDPPPEFAKSVAGDTQHPDAYDHPYYGYGWGWRARMWRWGPMWAWNRAIVTGAVAGGLYYWANYVNDNPHAQGGVMIAVFVLSIISLSSLVMAIFTTFNRPK